MHLFAAARGFSVLLLGGTLVGFVPHIESPLAIAPWKEFPASPGDDAARLDGHDRKELDQRQLRANAAPFANEDLSLTQDDLELAAPSRRRFEISAAHEATDKAAEPKIRLAAAETSAKPKDHVKAKVFLSLDKLPAGGKCDFAVVLEVEDGWHINANPPSPETMIPTKVTVLSKHRAKQLETKYPKGADLTIEEFPEPVSVYEGNVIIRGELQAASDAAGKTEELEFQIKYQACNEKTCLPPKTLKLAGQIPVVKPGTPVKQINQKYFSSK
jgi:hypothetical protein